MDSTTINVYVPLMDNVTGKHVGAIDWDAVVGIPVAAPSHFHKVLANS